MNKNQNNNSDINKDSIVEILIERNPLLYALVDDIIDLIKSGEIKSEADINRIIEGNFKLSDLTSFDRMTEGMKDIDDEMKYMIATRLVLFDAEFLSNILNDFENNKFDSFDEVETIYSIYLKVKEYLERKTNESIQAPESAIITKSEAIDDFKLQHPHLSINNKNTSFSNVNKSAPVFWFNISPEKFKTDLNLICCENGDLTLIHIPAGVVSNPEKVFYIRDNGKVHIEIPIKNQENYLIDKKSGFDFRSFVVSYSIKKDDGETPLSFWIDIVEKRAKTMTTDMDVKDLSLLHANEYVVRFSGDNDEDQVEFVKKRIEGFCNAELYFKDQLAKIKNKNSKKYKFLEACVYHASASLGGVMSFGEHIGMDTKLEILQHNKDYFKSVIQDYLEDTGHNLNAEAYKNLENGDVKSAKSNILKALEKSKDRPDFLDTLALCYYLNKEYELALNTIDKCIELEKDRITPEHLKNRIRILEALNILDRVKEDQKRLKEISPNYEDSKIVIKILDVFKNTKSNKKPTTSLKTDSTKENGKVKFDQNIKTSEDISVDEINSRRVFLRDTLIKLIYLILASVLVYVVYLFYKEYRRNNNLNRSERFRTQRGATRY